MGKKAAIWVSTVLYILITIAVLGIAFAALKPRIDEMRDKAVIEQSIEMLTNIDETIKQVGEVEGTRRQIQIQLKKGALAFECGDERISWEFVSSYKYSQLDKKVEIGNVNVLTKETLGGYKVTLSLEYENEKIDLKFMMQDPIKEFTAAEIPYTFFIENKGTENGKAKINIYTLSSQSSQS